MRWIFTLLGLLLVALAALGVVLPVLPTTPLLLLSCFCFTRSSQRLNNWFKRTKLYNKYVAEYMATKSLTVKQKRAILLTANSVMLVSFLLVGHWALRGILLACILSCNYVLIWRVRTAGREDRPAEKGSLRSARDRCGMAHRGEGYAWTSKPSEEKRRTF